MANLNKATNKLTLKTLDIYLKAQLPQYDFVKGRGYFYFGYNSTAPKDTPEPPPSIMVYALNQMTLKQWQEAIDSAIQEWQIKNNNHEM